MVKTLFICFIHGFKGDEETFFQFPEDLKNLVTEKLPELNVRTAVYPKYDAKDLAVSVENFKEWLQERVTALETDAATPRAIQNPSVGVILAAHSVGGFVAADTLFSILDNRPISSDPNTKLMFPLVHGLIAFDTPYNGLSRSMFAYGAFSQYQTLSSIWNVGTSVGALLTARGMATNQVVSSSARASSPSWKRWQLLAARTGTYGAIIAGGVAAYVNRKEIAESLGKVNSASLSSSWSKVNAENLREGLAQLPAYVSRESVGEGYAWVASHLKFVGALMRPAQLKTRLERLSHLKGVGVVNIYASLGENGYWTGGYFVPKRTFCAVPRETDKGASLFREQPNVEASDEVAAHCSMFRPEKNKGYREMGEKAADLVTDWVKNGPSAVVDDYEPSQRQRQQSISEAQLWDDDGKVLALEVEKKSEDEDALQLQAILDADGMPEAKDGGVSDEDLRKAIESPLPVEDVSEEDMKKLWNGDGEKDAYKTWRSRLANPFTRISLSSMPSIPSMPSMANLPSIPSIPSFGKTARAKEDDKDVITDDVLKRKAEDAFPEETTEKGVDVLPEQDKKEQQAVTEISKEEQPHNLNDIDKDHQSIAGLANAVSPGDEADPSV